ncbi:MAG: FAD-dependent oxidoreductase [Desulfobacteraceae bacterium]|nr:FAD-dependent oxidoreductase [Desulfobacteraceae bacterium]
MKQLFSTFSIKNCYLKNRIVMPGLASFLVEDDGAFTDKTVEHYRLRAAGGPAMVIMEASAVSPEGIVSPHQARIYDDKFMNGLSRIAEVIRSEGAVPGIQLHHGGRQTSARVIKQKPVAPSNLPCPTIRGDVEPLTIGGIQEIVHKFADAATRAIKAGFELIELHGAHGYLINQFLSRFSNIREDEYGGDITGRTRFACDIVREIRERVGEDFPLSFKISAQEFVPDGITVDESIEILKPLVQAGIDIVQVSAGNDATPEWISQPMFMEKACLADSAASIKKELDIPVMAVGRINDPLTANSIIEEGKADLVCIGRGLLADPEMPKKAKEGRLDEIRTCVACNTCMESIFRKGRVECLVNPTLGREKEMEIHPTNTPKKVMVIGGGPGGLNVAWVAAKKGHEVSLYEKQALLGGQLILGCVSNFKKELRSLIDFQKRQIKKYGVKCHLNIEATLDTVKDENPDVVILATGSVPIKPSIEGIDTPIVSVLPQIFDGNRPIIKKTLIIGGGATGCEAALYLSENGCPVTIVEKLPKIGMHIESVTKRVILNKLEENNVRIVTEYELSRIAENGVFIRNREGKEVFLEGESVVIAIGTRPDNSLYSEINSQGITIYQIGDCLEPRGAKAAISEGAEIGRAI